MAHAFLKARGPVMAASESGQPGIRRFEMPLTFGRGCHTAARGCR